MTYYKFSIKKRIQSFKHAFNGLKILIYEEHNARVHVVAAVLAICLSLILKINTAEWLAILICIGMVISAEIFNSAIENICDFISPEKHQQIKKIKDLSAAAVLVLSLISLGVGLFIFVPDIIAVGFFGSDS